MRFLDYNDKLDIMKAFWKRGSSLELHGVKVLLFEDFSSDVAKRRCAFSSHCSLLYAQKKRFHVLYPATLLVSLNKGPPRSYTTTGEVEKALADLLEPSRNDKDSSSPRKHQHAMGNRGGPAPCHFLHLNSRPCYLLSERPDFSS